MADIKISELQPTTDLEGLYTIGSDKNNLSKKVPLQFLREAADYAIEQGDYAKQEGSTIESRITDFKAETDAKLTVLSADSAELNLAINGAEEEEVNLSAMPLEDGFITGGVFQNEGNYGLRKHILFSAQSGRTIIVTPQSTSIWVEIAFLKSNLVVGQAPNYCNGTTLNTIYHKTLFEIPSDCLYVYIYARNKDGISYLPSEFLYTEYEGMSSDITELKEKTENIETQVFQDSTTSEDVQLQIKTSDGANGYWDKVGNWIIDNARASTETVDVELGEKYLVTTNIGGSTNIAYLAQWNNGVFVGVAEKFVGGTGNAENREYIVPNGVTEIALSSYNTTPPSLKLVGKEVKFYTKTQSDDRYKLKGEDGFGVRWSISDMDDLGERCFAAVGKKATIGVGSVNGESDFDNIYPWSEIKRCNIKTNANGAKIVTFEGEDGFSLNGDNGDVFVRIPRFSVKKYIKDDYEYRVITANADNVHTAFIEDGKVLDEIFISAFESFDEDGKLRSIAGVIPTNNITPSEFLSKAVANGNGYSLFDNRCVDLLWTLMAVEYGCRNTNHILGYGYSGYLQAAQYQESLSVTRSEQSTNSVTLGKPSSNSNRLQYLAQFAVGQNICICGDNVDGAQTNIIAQRKITSVSCNSTDDNLVITFDGPPISVYEKTDGSTKYTYVGNAPATTNMCETAIGNNAQLKWHTGRSARSGVVNFGELFDNTANPCRYRWIENPIGNLWHFLPDVTFVSQQMYVCNNMKDYECHKHNAPYYPIGNILIEQQDNGVKNDITDANYWIDRLVNDIFAKGVVFGKSYNKSLLSTQGFGAYYYLKSNNEPVIISHGGGFDHLWRCNMLTLRAWQDKYAKWYLYGARLMYKNIN